jgi:thioredoxin-related protein
MISRREFGAIAGVGTALAAMPRGAGAVGVPDKAFLGEDGMYHQSWFLDSFLILGEDLAETKESGKRFAVVWEQKGCPYCKETHLVNFANHQIQYFIRENFEVLQLDLWGSRKVTDFDGEVMEERALARKWGILFTPTFMFFDDDLKKAKEKGVRGIEVTRMPGYFKPFHFLTMFEYVQDRAYVDQHFQKYLIAKGRRMRAEGKEVKLW